MRKRIRARRLGAALARQYPQADCALRHSTPWQLLAAAILSAQCTDVRVNRITPLLFRRFPDVRAMAAAAQGEVEELIRSAGVFRNKARALREAARDILTRHGGEVPRTLEELTALRGVGRKTANVLLGNAFGRPALVVDTHVLRLARRLGLSRERDPAKVERDLCALFPPEEWVALSHRLIRHGRAFCRAPRPSCGACPLKRICPYDKKCYDNRPIKSGKPSNHEAN